MKYLYETLSNRLNFTKGQQQDAGEAITRLFDALKEDTTSSIVPIERLSSIISTFKKCMTCGEESFLNDKAAHVLRLAPEKISGNTKQLIQNLVDFHFEKETMKSEENHLECEKCKTETDHLLETFCTVCPDVLILVIKRYDAKLKKVNKNIKVEDIITLKEQKGMQHTHQYELQGVVVHHGSTMDRGHYTAVLRSEKEIKWHEANDSSIRQIPREEITATIERNCYILLYEKLPESTEKWETVFTPLKKLPEFIHEAYNLQNRDLVMAKIDEISLKGKDLKTLGYPQRDFSYSLENKGYLRATVCKNQTKSEICGKARNFKIAHLFNISSL